MELLLILFICVAMIFLISKLQKLDQRVKQTEEHNKFLKEEIKDLKFYNSEKAKIINKQFEEIKKIINNNE